MRLSYSIDNDLKKIGIRSTVVAEVLGLAVESSNQGLEELKTQALSEIIALDDKSIIENPVLIGYRELVQQIGRSAKKFPPAAETLIGQIRRTGKFPTINSAVDSYNVVVSRRYLALGVHDISKLGSAIRFRLSPGGEPFLAIGGLSQKLTQPGDYVYADDHQLLAWLDSKDSEFVKVSQDTKNLVIVIQGTAQTERSYNFSAAEEACKIITRFCGGTYEIASVD